MSTSTAPAPTPDDVVSPGARRPIGAIPPASPADHEVPEPLLEVDEIQGNILAGFNKDHQVLLAVTINDVPAARAWLAGFVDEVATTREVLRFNNLFRELRSRRGADPQGLAATWINVAFSAEGLRKLTSDEEVAAIPDKGSAFRMDLLARFDFLGDPTDPKAEGNPKRWKVGGPGKVPDVLVIVAGDDLGHLRTAVRHVTPPVDPQGKQPKVIWKEQGDTRPDLPGHEHFGFKDGISQPGVRGLVSHDPDLFLTPRLIDPSDDRSKVWSAPGQPLVWPGHFVLGYPLLDPNSRQVVDGPPLKFPWFRNGSFLVFRRLRQDVKAFRDFVESETKALEKLPGFEGITPARFASMLVGRWPHGAPLLRTDHDDEVMGANAWANNHFLYANASSPVLPQAGSTASDPYPSPPADLQGRICPHAAHVRKVNPRDVHTDIGDEPTTLVRRILRRGIPFGKPLPDPPPPDDRGNRGLHFLCYQASISLQFESLTHDWANQVSAPEGRPAGHDPIIGQKGPGVPEREFDLTPIHPTSEEPKAIRLAREWVISTGGGYFFSPSICAIRNRLCKPAAPA